MDNKRDSQTSEKKDTKDAVVPLTGTTTMESSSSTQSVKSALKLSAATPVNPKVLQLQQLVNTYKTKVSEYKKTGNKDIKLWKYFWQIGEYVLESKTTEVMNAFFSLYTHDEDLYDQTMALCFIYECKDSHVKNTVAAFYQVNDTLRRYFSDRSKGKAVRCFLSIKAVARTFEGYETFVNWVNEKKSK